MTGPSEPAPALSGRVAAHVAGRHYNVVALTAAALVAADQLTKWWAVNRLSDGRVIDSIGSLRFRLAFNSGAAFSMGSGRGLGPFIGVLVLVVVAVLLFTGETTRSRAGAVAVGLIASGAIGNLLDRAFRRNGSGFLGGPVVDFVDLQWWPTFNVADASICVGAVGLALFGMRGKEPTDSHS